MLWFDGGKFEFKRRRNTQNFTADVSDFFGTCNDLLNTFKPDRCQTKVGRTFIPNATITGFINKRGHRWCVVQTVSVDLTFP